MTHQDIIDFRSKIVSEHRVPQDREWNGVVIAARLTPERVVVSTIDYYLEDPTPDTLEEAIQEIEYYQTLQN